MTSLQELMKAVRDLRDALHERLDDNVTDRVFRSLRLRHAQAVLQARREVEDPSLPAASEKYDPVISDLNAAKEAVAEAVDTDEPQMLAACQSAKVALDQVAALP